MIYRLLKDDHDFIALIDELRDSVDNHEGASNLHGALHYLTVIETDLQARVAIIAHIRGRGQLGFLDYTKRVME